MTSMPLVLITIIIIIETIQCVDVEKVDIHHVDGGRGRNTLVGKALYSRDSPAKSLNILSTRGL